jgi:hypothetical protein
MQMYMIKFCENIGLFAPGYQKGLLTGMVFLAALLLIMKFIHILFRVSRYGHCNGIRTKGTNGQLFVYVSAVKDIVRGMETEFKGLSIHTTKLYRRGKKFSIKIIASLNSYNTNLSALVPDFQTRLISILGTNLGISNISSVDIDIKRVR